MKYSHLKTSSIKDFSFERFDGGLNTHNREDLILDNQLSDGANLLYKDGVLTSREGLTFNLDEVIGNFDNYGFFHKGLTVTDTQIARDDKIYRVAFALWGDSSSYQTLYIYFVSQDKRLTPAGNFQFKRTSQDIYYKFSNIVFLVGSKTLGCGLYAFLTLKSGSEGLYEIYELNTSFDEWIKITDDSVYTPTVLINGKGNKYDDAVTEDGFSAEATSKPEKFNMLTSRFKAYFTTDGHSDTFQLPIKKIDENSDVLCRFYVSKNYYYEWLIPAGDNAVTSETDSGNITMCCYRNSATVVFFDSEGNIFPMPRSYLVTSNNLFVKTSREAEDAIDQIVGCEHCTIYNSNVFFYGNEQNASNVYVTTTSNPLYFAENMKSSIGNPSDKVTAMAVQNNKLIAFKSGEIYQVSLEKNESELLSDSLWDGSSLSFENKQIRLSFIHGSIGCINKNTLAVCGNRLVWLGNDANVYTLATTTYGKENNVYCLSDSISNILKTYSDTELSSAFGFNANGYYVLHIAKSLYLLNYRIKNFGISPVYTALGKPPETISWYVLKLPHQKYYSGYFTGNEINLFCGDINSKYCVLSTLYGENDNILSYENGTAVQKKQEIKSSITTKFFCFGSPHTRKIIEEVYIGMEFSGEADIILNDDNIEYKQTVFSPRNNTSPIRIAPHFKGVYGLSITVSSNANISLRGIQVKYKNMV